MARSVPVGSFLILDAATAPVTCLYAALRGEPLFVVSCQKLICPHPQLVGEELTSWYMDFDAVEVLPSHEAQSLEY
jgi:hypothetical protein